MDSTKSSMVEKREKFTSGTGFILACAGAAVGMGNLWMFPWRLGQYGGAAFLVPYLIFVIGLGMTGLEHIYLVYPMDSTLILLQDNLLVYIGSFSRL